MAKGMAYCVAGPIVKEKMQKGGQKYMERSNAVERGHKAAGQGFVGKSGEME